jgi:uncharacterized YccA/Bax inhibitor family protein
VAGLTNRDLALIVLGIGVMRHYGYVPFEPEMRGAMSKALGGLAMVLITPLIYKAAPSRAMLAVLAWWVFESLQVFLCSTAYAINPWPIATGDSICSARLDFDFGAIGIMIAAILLWRLSIRKVSSIDPSTKGRQ